MKKIVSASLGIPLLIAAIIYGEIPFFILITIFSLIAWIEMISVFHKLKTPISPFIGLFYIVFSTMCAYFGNFKEMLIITMVYTAVSVKGRNTQLFFSGLYIAWSFAAIIWLRIYDETILYITQLFIVTNGMAIIAGLFLYGWLMAIGKKSLKKLVAINSLLSLLLYKAFPLLGFSNKQTIILISILSITTLLNILLVARFKKKNHIRFFGRIIPGFGGINDCGCSIMLPAISLYLFNEFM